MVFFGDTTIALKNHLLNTGADCKSNILTDKLVEIFLEIRKKKALLL